MKVAFVSGRHAYLAEGANMALVWYCNNTNVNVEWLSKEEADKADMILFYTENPNEDLWDFECCKKYIGIPRYYLLGNLEESCIEESKKSIFYHRLSEIQTGFLNYINLLKEAFYYGKSKQFIKAAKKGSYYENEWFKRAISRIVFSLLKYGEVYYGRNF
ncbi:MAG: hypothetical protein K6E13_10680 [Lachnospiraceae bacterium]|nr:hypothetical protein [Lachnospiraceae bacterium]